MNRDEKYRATHKEQRNAYDRAYYRRHRPAHLRPVYTLLPNAPAKQSLIERLLSKIRRTK